MRGFALAECVVLHPLLDTHPCCQHTLISWQTWCVFSILFPFLPFMAFSSSSSSFPYLPFESMWKTFLSFFLSISTVLRLPQCCSSCLGCIYSYLCHRKHVKPLHSRTPAIACCSPATSSSYPLPVPHPELDKHPIHWLRLYVARLLIQSWQLFRLTHLSIWFWDFETRMCVALLSTFRLRDFWKTMSFSIGYQALKWDFQNVKQFLFPKNFHEYNFKWNM